MEDAHFRTTQEVLNYFNTDPNKGLTQQQVRDYTAKYGKNGMINIYIYYPYHKQLYKL